MLIGIQPDQMGKQSYSDKWIEYLKQKNINYEVLDLFNPKLNLNKLKKYDGIMWRWNLEYPDRIVAPEILDIIENNLNIPVYPDFNTRNTWDNKIKQHYLFSANKINTPKTWVFYDEMEAKKWANNAIYPYIFKLAKGASSSGVTLIKNKKEAYNIIKKIFNGGIYTNSAHLDEIKKNKLIKPTLRKIKNVCNKEKIFKQNKRNILEKNYVYFQELLQNNEFDIRVTIIDNRAFAFRRFNRENDFRASGSGKIDYNQNVMDKNIIKKAFEINKKLKFNCMAYDFVYNNEKEVSLLEICWTFNDYAVSKCPGYWNKNLEFIEESKWPEELQINFFINTLSEKI